MLTIHTPQVTTANESGLQTSTEPSPALLAALTTAGIGDIEIWASDDDTVRIDHSDSHIAVGEENGWITATANDEALIYEGKSIDHLAAAIARWAR